MELLVEILLEVLGEALVELTIASLGEAATHRSQRPVLAAVGSAVFGVAVGAISLWPLPHHLIHSPGARLVSLIVTPLLVGAMLGARGYLRKSPRFIVRSFVSGVLLAAAVGLVRYLGAS